MGFLDAIGEGEPLSLSVGDLSTPGAFWLNPALPRNEKGESVDPQTGLP